MTGSELQHWADEAMYESEPIKGGIKVYLLTATADPLGAIAAASKMYKGEVVRNMEDVTDDERRHFWEQSKATHLKAPLEFVDLHFMIEGVTRSFTHQMVRQRTAVYAQESLRFAVKENMADEVAQPPSIEAGTSSEIRWTEAIKEVGEAYDALIAMGIPAEDARGLLPHAVTTRLHYKTNLRNLLEHAGNRLCTQAQFEWRLVLTLIVQAIRNYSGFQPMGDQNLKTTGWQFKHIANDNVFRPVCYQLGHCPFTAEYDRKCSIRERVQAGEWDQIDDREWLLDPGAAR